MYRHGDLLIVPVASLPGAAVQESRDSVVLAYGEATGHAHRVEQAGAELWQHLNERYLVLARPGRITHEEHAAVELPAGIYQVIRQRVYTPAEIRYVAD